MAKREDFNCGQLTVAGANNKGTTVKQVRIYTTAALAPGALTTGVPVNVAAGGATLADITVTDIVIAVLKPIADAALLYNAQATVSAAGAVQVQFVGNTGVTPSGANVYRLVVMRL